MTPLKNIQSFIHKPNTNTVVYSYILTLLHCCCHCCAVWRLSHEQKTKRKSFLFWVWRCSNNNKTVEITCFHPFIIMQNCQIVILFMYCVLGDTQSSFSRVQSYFLQSDVHRHRVQLVFCKPRVIRKPGQDSVDQREWWEFIQSKKEIKQKKVHSLLCHLVTLAMTCGLGTPNQSQSWFLWVRTVARSLSLKRTPSTTACHSQIKSV